MGKIGDQLRSGWAIRGVRIAVYVFLAAVVVGTVWSLVSGGAPPPEVVEPVAGT
jgi:hypothetical protein